MTADVVRSLVLDEAESGRQARHTEDVGRAALEEVRELTRLRLAGRVAAGSAFAPGSYAGARADVEGAGAGRAQQRLVSGERQQVDVRLLHVERHDARRLGRVDEEEQVGRAGEATDLRDGLDGAEDVAGMRQGDQPRLRRDGGAKIVG